MWLEPEGRILTDWAAIAREHGGMAFETAWRILGNASDTEDAVQDAFVDALRLHRQKTAIGNWGALLRHLASRRALDRKHHRGTDPRVYDGLGAGSHRRHRHGLAGASRLVTGIAQLVRGEIIAGRAPDKSGIDFTDSSSLVETGILDSVGVFTLVAFLEQQFHIEVPDEDLVWANFESVDAITRFVEKKLR